MKLKEIKIENFRSIKSAKITFEHNCQILVGKNEAGKSNILKAIAAVFGQYVVSDKDKRKEIDDEKIEDYYVRVVFKVENDDFTKILESTKKQLIELLVFKNEKTILEYLQTYFKEFLLCIDIATSEKTAFSYWRYDKNDFELEMDIYLHGENYNIDSKGSVIDIKSLFFDKIKELYNDDPYYCYYFKSNIQTIPSNIQINDFLANPIDEKFSIIRDAFHLCGYTDIQQAFSEHKSKDGDYINLLSKVSKKLTETFKKIWKDFNDTKIELIESGPQIIIKISNKSKFSYEDRSDGFKKFLTILLRLSVKNKIGNLTEQDIILLDEPDQSLYPTSARYLRDELLKIAEKSKVIYATHSQYMLDSECIDRHIIVEKKDDITTLNKQEKNAPFSNDELLLNVIETSIFECLQKNNIIFEGWLDKVFFDKYCAFNKVKNFENAGKVYLGGISGAETLVQLLMLADKNFLIVSDSDKTSTEKKKKFCENYSEYAGSWFSYGDVLNGDVTVEDFLSPAYVEKYLKTKQSNFVHLADKTAMQNIESVESEKTEKQKIKTELITNAAKKDIRKEYTQFIELLKTFASLAWGIKHEK